MERETHAVVSIGRAGKITAGERDRALRVDESWPPESPPDRWDRHADRLSRVIRADEPDQDEVLPVALEESILRFPSAPLHGLQRRHEHHVDLGLSENMHTYRVLRGVDQKARSSPIERIFLMHTGLNERDRMGLYYKIASQLIRHNSSTVCIVRPFPGHLTRFPFQGFAETPLDRYLWDGSHLFRQFMRHMLETQWFLSALARRSSYRNASGANLLGEADDKAESRLKADVLAQEMSSAWELMHDKSKIALENAVKDSQRAPQVKDPPAPAAMEQAIVSLRELLNLEADFPGKLGDEDLGSRVEPAVHVFGYSLGGFAAQSVFMSWPFLIASCCTLLGAGALRELAPTAFADPEEWQTVLHSLRYELDDRMMSDDVTLDQGRVAGVDLELFTFFKRTFYEVFQQEYKGSFQTRLEAFRKRMLFVVGGNDPVVRPKSVLDAAPPGGINLLEMGGIGHFLDGRAETRNEEQQLTFWVREMAAVLSRFAESAADDQATERPLMTFDIEMARPATSKELFDRLLESGGGTQVNRDGRHTNGLERRERVQRLTAAEFLAIDPEGALPGDLFERCLDDMLARVDSTTAGDDEGVLFMLRNEIPTLLLHDSLIRERAAALYHDDRGIVRYCHGVATRREVIRDHPNKVCIVLPWNARRLMNRMDLLRGYPSQAESAGGHVRSRLSDEDAWTELRKECNQLVQGNGQESIRCFDGQKLLTEREPLSDDLRIATDKILGGEKLTQVAALPDCWVWISRSVFGIPILDASDLTIPRAIQELGRVLSRLNKRPEDDLKLLNELRNDRIRLVTVSRARYNPRFRGRLIADPRRARKLLLHVALCLSLSESIANQAFADVFE